MTFSHFSEIPHKANRETERGEELSVEMRFCLGLCFEMRCLFSALRNHTTEEPGEVGRRGGLPASLSLPPTSKFGSGLNQAGHLRLSFPILSREGDTTASELEKN